MTKQREAFESLEIVKNTICLETYADGKYKSIFAIVAYDVFKASQADKLGFARKIIEETVNACESLPKKYLGNDKSGWPEYGDRDFKAIDTNAIIAKVEQEQ